MRKYFIIGAGGFAKEVYQLCRNTLNEKIYIFEGFIDYKPKSELFQVGDIKHKVYAERNILRKVDNGQNIDMYIGIGNPDIIKQIVEKFKGFNFPNLISNNSSIYNDVIELGRGNIFTNGVIVTVDVKIGSFNIFNLNTTVGHDTEIGDGNVFNPSCNISGETIIGSNNLFGTGSKLVNNLKIGNNSKVGAGSVVLKNIEDNTTVMGNPARIISKS